MYFPCPYFSNIIIAPFALCVLELRCRHAVTAYTRLLESVKRAPICVLAGESRMYAVGQMSVQRAAAFVLDQYVRDFPALERHAAAELSVRRYEALLTAKLGAMHSRAVAAAAAAANANANAVNTMNTMNTNGSSSNNNTCGFVTYPMANFGGGTLNTMNGTGAGTGTMNACPYNDVECAECARCARCQFYSEYAASSAQPTGCPQPTLTVPPPPPPSPPPLPSHQPSHQHQTSIQSAAAGTQTSTPEQQTQGTADADAKAGVSGGGQPQSQPQGNKTQFNGKTNGKSPANAVVNGAGGGLANGEAEGEQQATEVRREYPAQEDVLFVRSNGGASPVGAVYQNLRSPTGTIPIPISDDLTAPPAPSGPPPEITNNNNNIDCDINCNPPSQNPSVGQSINAPLEQIPMQPLRQHSTSFGVSTSMGAGVCRASAPLPALAAGDFGGRDSPPSPTRFLTAHPTLYPPQLSRKQIRQLAEWELERRLSRRRARLLVAAEEVFARVRRVLVPQSSRSPSGAREKHKSNNNEKLRTRCGNGGRANTSSAPTALSVAGT